MQNNMYTGRLTRDPEVRYSQGDNPMAIAKFGFAISHHPRGAKESITTFINCVAFSSIAEVIEKHVHKGSELYISGYWKNNDYTDKNGNKVYAMQFNVESLEFGRRPGENTGGTRQDNEPMPAPTEGYDGFMNIPDGIDEELPFN